MFEEEYLAGKAVEGLAKGASSTLLKHRFRSSNNQNSPISKPDKGFWGEDGQLYCPVNKVPKQQRQVNDTTVREQDPLQRQAEIPPIDYTEPPQES